MSNPVNYLACETSVTDRYCLCPCLGVDDHLNLTFSDLPSLVKDCYQSSHWRNIGEMLVNQFTHTKLVSKLCEIVVKSA
jgi:hypothetical protein